MRRPILLAVMIASLGGVAACAYAQHRAPMRGEKIDIGGEAQDAHGLQGRAGVEAPPSWCLIHGAFGTAAT